jgi:hypothetical protein
VCPDSDLRRGTSERAATLTSDNGARPTATLDGGQVPPALAPLGTSEVEPFWPAQLGAAAALLFYLSLPHRLIMGPRWLVPGVEGVLLLTLVLTTPTRHSEQSVRLRAAVISLLAVISATTMISLILLARFLLQGSKTGGEQLIFAGGVLWVTTILICGIWFWELDRGGPGKRCAGERRSPDFLFPQMTEPHLAPGWRPRFVDYLYTSYTNAAAFSPTDTMPLTPLAKMLMAGQSLIALITLLLVVSRAVNILG